ncbi:hypothetical protein GOY14_02675 [Wolbachia endosymbiont of Dipetalonema caudispina]|uniref:F0F1 ATP synthase subunit B family protein n=1 Tax=Wolbachia endosymbiont of Dipetalonema caudispina TaxID=1812112 RepID=UPI00158DDB16|nr:hypothetical protein [Wolbachia endosymbiont of Dipetalonema caudispina]QKX01217.1 hypothetical protein GOY14_02675 [Wolbachia endosymbiont of Dipetalonema caudispina]
MPQLDTSTFFSQIFWFSIFFFLLFFIVSSSFLPKLDEIIKMRNKRILDSFNNSIRLLQLIESQTIKYNLALNKAKIQAKKIIDNTFIQVEEMKANVKNTIKEKDKKMNKLIEEKIAKFKSEYTDELKQMAINIASIYYNKLTSSKIEEEFIANLISKEF